MTPRFVLIASFHLGLLLPACFGTVDSTADDDNVTTTGNNASSDVETVNDDVATTGNIASSDGSASADTAGTTGGVTNGGSAAADPPRECDGACLPCDEGQRRHECATCTCELIDDPQRVAHEQLLACRGWEEPCGPAALWVNPNGGLHDWSGAECLFTALHDRTPGRLDFTDKGDVGFVGGLTELVFLLDGSDRVFVLSSGYGGPTYENRLAGFSPVESCVLDAPSAFDQCIADGDENTCDSWRDWFNECVPVNNPSCPAE